MTSGSRASLLHPIRTLFSAGSVGGMSDGQLLEQFLSRRDEGAEAAFTALVSIHGPMVWDLCRSILSDPHAAEDAFQATFLILARRAGSIRRRDAVGPWLHGVARRVAVRARAAEARRRRHEGQGRELEPIPMPAPDPADREQVEALHEEVDRLMEKYRAPVVLCYFEGRTHAEAARLLGCPVGTVSIRLSRARQRLRARLARRGLVLPAAIAGASLIGEGVSAARPVGPAGSTIKAAMDLAAGKLLETGAIPIPAAILAEGVLRTMKLTRIITAAAGLLAVTLLTAGAGMLAAGEGPARVGPGQAPQATPSPQAVVVPRAAPTPQAAPPARAEVDGRDARAVAVREDDRPPVKFFDLRDRARSVVYAIDGSGSMASRRSLDVAKRELLASLDQLTPEVQFAVLFYNLETRILSDSRGHRGLMAATADNRKRVQSQVEKVMPKGGTDHMKALEAALALKPEVIFFLTDADLVTKDDVEEILARMGKAPTGAGVMAGFRGFLAAFRPPPESQKTHIQVIEFGRGPGPQRGPLRRLATATGGSYLYRDVTQFPKAE